NYVSLRKRCGFHKLGESCLLLDRIKSHADTFTPITSGTTGLLVIARHRSPDIVMDDIAHFGVIDPHTKGNCRYNHIDVLHQEFILRFGACLCVQSSVVWKRTNTVNIEHFSNFLDLLATQTIDDSCLAGIIADKLYDFLDHILFGPDLVM